MLKIVLYIAASKDGFIADKNGSVSWLDKYNGGREDYGYADFFSGIDAIAFGKNTYNQVVSFGPWVFPSKKSYVFADANTQPVHKNVEIITTAIPDFIRKAEAAGVKRLWLMGGAQLIDSFYKLGFIDEYIITVMPTRLGTGIELTPAIFRANGLRLVEEIPFASSGIVQKRYVSRS